MVTLARTTPAGHSAPTLPFSARLLRSIIRSGLRGSTRLSTYLPGVLRSLHAVPIQVAAGQVIYLDMREEWCRECLCHPPRGDGPPGWEPDEQEVMRRVVRPGEVAFDIGANLGEHSALLSQLVAPGGRLYAFEPNPERLEPLACTVNQQGNGTVVQVALSDRSGRRSLFVPVNRSMSSLADWTHGEGGPVRAVSCEEVPLDRLVEDGRVPRPDFVKCDVEGAELLVFRGAAVTLDRPDAPIVMYEANLAAANAFGLDIRAATSFLESLPSPRYALFWVRPGGVLQPIREFPPDVRLFNLLAVPASKMDRVT